MSQEMAAEFRALRTVKGHFQGEVWNADVDAWMGRKHQVMLELAKRLGASGCTEAQVKSLLGEPDRIAREGDATFDQVRNTPGFQAPAGASYDLLIYEWRGDHDLLYLISQDQVVVASGWWNAGD